MWGANIENKSGRGCLLYAKIKLGAKEILLKKLYNEYVLIEITCKGRDEKILVCCIYRSPNSSLENNATLCDCITELSKIKCKNIIMVGDFNYGHINWENLSSQNNTERNFIDKLQDNYLSQMVTVPTRKRGSDRSTMLDLIITKQPDKITDIDIRSPLGSSDHATIYFNIITEPKNIKREKIVYFYNKGNYREMCKKVSEYDWSNILEKSKHIDEQWESFAELITNAQEIHIPHKTIDMNKNKSNSWKVPRTKEMKIIENKRDRKWTRYMETGNLNHYKEFCSYRNKVKKL